jgi:hypothetical protein
MFNLKTVMMGLCVSGVSSGGGVVTSKSLQMSMPAMHKTTSLTSFGVIVPHEEKYE